MSIERIAAQQLQVNARGFAHLGGAARLDPALGGDADAAHAPSNATSSKSTSAKSWTAASSRAARSHSSGPRQAVSKSKSSSPSFVRTHLPACGLP